MGAAIYAFLGGRLRPGSEIVTEAVGLDAAVSDADLVITGEGRIDGQTAFGKTPVGVARVAKRHNKPLLPSAVHCEATWALFSRTASTPLPACCTALAALMKHWPKAGNLRMAARNVASMVAVGLGLNGRAR